MKKQNHTTAPVRSQFSVLRQICHLIPNHLVPRLARETGTERRCRTFSAWSHCAALLFAQLTHALGLNDVCDSLRLHSGPLSAVRGATPPSAPTPTSSAAAAPPSGSPAPSPMAAATSAPPLKNTPFPRPSPPTL